MPRLGDDLLPGRDALPHQRLRKNWPPDHPVKLYNGHSRGKFSEVYPTNMWSSGISSTVVSNTAVALVFTPIIQGLHGLNKLALWSALILGTNLGGATTPLSGSVWILALGVLRREGFTVSFVDFTKIGVITTVIQLCIASLYLILRFGLVV